MLKKLIGFVFISLVVVLSLALSVSLCVNINEEAFADNSKEDNSSSDTHKHYLCGDSDCQDEHIEVNFDRTMPNSEYNELSGNYLLNTDINATRKLTYNILSDTNICLGGHSIESNSVQFILVGGVKLSICDCRSSGAIYSKEAQSPMITPRKDDYNINTTFELYGGSLEGASNIIYSNSTNKQALNVLINGGVVRSSGETAVYLRGEHKDISLTINGGTIETTGNDMYALNVYDLNSVIKGGTITSANGIAVKNSYSDITINEARIKGKSAVADVEDGGQFSINGGLFSHDVTAFVAKGYFSSDNDEISTKNAYPYVVKKLHTHAVCGNDDCNEHSAMDFEPWKFTDSLPSSGFYYLSKDVDISQNAFETQITGELTICLNGKKLTGISSHDMFFVDSGKLTICDCDGNGEITSKVGNLTRENESISKNIIRYLGSSTINVYGGKITNEGGTAIRCVDKSATNSSFTLHNGSVISNSGSAIHIDYGTVNILNGTVSTQSSLDYAIYSGNSTRIFLHEGKVANTSGIAILLNGSSTVQIDGAVNISGNEADISVGYLSGTSYSAPIKLNYYSENKKYNVKLEDTVSEIQDLYLVSCAEVYTAQINVVGIDEDVISILSSSSGLQLHTHEYKDGLCSCGEKDVITITYSNAFDTESTYTQEKVLRSVTFALFANGFTREGYDFIGWATNPDGEAVYQNGQSAKFANDVTLYAVWGESLQSQIDNANKIIETLKENITALQNKDGELENNLQVLNDNLNLANALIDNLDTRLSETKTTLEEAIATTKGELEEIINSLRDALDKSVEDLENTISSNKSDMDEKLLALETAYKNADSVIHSELSILKTEDTSVRESIESLTSSTTNADNVLKQTIDTVQANLDKAVENLTESLSGNKMDIEEKLTALEIAYKEADTLISSEIASFKSEDTAFKQSIENLISTSGDASESINLAVEKLRKELENSKKQIEENKRSIKSLSTVVAVFLVLFGLAILGITAFLVLKFRPVSENKKTNELTLDDGTETTEGDISENSEIVTDTPENYGNLFDSSRKNNIDSYRTYSEIKAENSTDKPDVNNPFYIDKSHSGNVDDRYVNSRKSVESNYTIRAVDAVEAKANTLGENNNLYTNKTNIPAEESAADKVNANNYDDDSIPSDFLKAKAIFMEIFNSIKSK